jgi:hypothetical protein
MDPRMKLGVCLDLESAPEEGATAGSRRSVDVNTRGEHAEGAESLPPRVISTK